MSEPKTPGTGPAFRLPFDNSFFRDMQGFYVPWKPEPSPAPAWVQFNDALALARDERAAGRKHPGGTELQKRVLTAGKSRPDRAWLGEVSGVALIQAVRDA
ncbi:MAG TPA: hypothetical protein PKY40_13400, partial [Burkholderiaceae bacterium]|nr:hypothetical protein [Burkholderiaceae bacterium]